jgi:hypothetical protein
VRSLVAALEEPVDALVAAADVEDALKDSAALDDVARSSFALIAATLRPRADEALRAWLALNAATGGENNIAGGTMRPGVLR